MKTNHNPDTFAVSGLCFERAVLIDSISRYDCFSVGRYLPGKNMLVVC